MTSTITITCPEEVVLGADKFITYPMTPDRRVLKHIIAEKVYLSSKTNVGISFWGLGDYGAAKGIDFLRKFDEENLSSNDFVDEIASKLKEKLEAITPKIQKRCGFHVSGYLTSAQRPKLRHVFHESWHDVGEFTNENCHKEYHNSDGDLVIYRYERDYPVLFNGDNFIANSLFNIAKIVRPYIRIIPRKLSLKECTEIVALIIGISINRLDYYFDISKYEKIDPDVGGGISILVIGKKEPKWIPIKCVPIYRDIIELSLKDP